MWSDSIPFVADVGSMMSAVAITRVDLDAAGLRRAAACSKDSAAARRMLALALVLEGVTRQQAASTCGMDRQTLRDWVHRYNAEGVEGLKDRPRSGRPPRLDESRQAALKALILKGPDVKRDGCAAWRIRDLCGLVEHRFAVGYSETGMLRLLKGLDLSRQKARPVHPEANPKAQERFKKACLP